jgi:hypothetical protein
LEHQEVSSKRDTFELSNSNFDTEAEGEVRQLPLVKERQEWMLDSMPPPRRGCLPFTSNRNPEEFGPQTIEHYTFGGASAEGICKKRNHLLIQLLNLIVSTSLTVL